MVSYVWLAHDRDGTHDWFDAANDDAAMAEARRLTVPVFDSAHVHELTVEVWTTDGERLLGFIEHRLEQEQGHHDA